MKRRVAESVVLLSFSVCTFDLKATSSCTVYFYFSRADNVLGPLRGPRVGSNPGCVEDCLGFSHSKTVYLVVCSKKKVRVSVCYGIDPPIFDTELHLFIYIWVRTTGEAQSSWLVLRLTHLGVLIYSLENSLSLRLAQYGCWSTDLASSFRSIRFTVALIFS